jgi:hypothetical protein
VEIRHVRPADWRSLKRLRFRALETDPDTFGSTLAEERAKPDTAWQEWAPRIPPHGSRDRAARPYAPASRLGDAWWLGE